MDDGLGRSRGFMQDELGSCAQLPMLELTYKREFVLNKRMINIENNPTYHALISAAIHAFARMGYAATAVRTISTQAGANQALVSYYFGGKEGLYQAALAESNARFQRIFREIGMGSNQIKQTFNLVENWTRFSEDEPDAYRIVFCPDPGSPMTADSTAIRAEAGRTLREACHAAGLDSEAASDCAASLVGAAWYGNNIDQASGDSRPLGPRIERIVRRWVGSDAAVSPLAPPRDTPAADPAASRPATIPASDFTIGEVD